MSVYDIVTERIIQQLEAGVAPWRKPWTSSEPSNFVSKKAYRGINVFLLSCSGYASPYFLTYKQATQLGGQVRKGEHGHLVVFWKWNNPVRKLDKQDEDTPQAKTRNAPILRYYTVFNVEQCDGLTLPETGRTIEPLEAAEAVVSGYTDAPKIQGGQQASYSPTQDTVTMPARNTFESAPAYYSTIFHELAHSTGHKSRLNRKEVAESVISFGSNDYSREELVAEMGAAMLCGKAGLNETVPQSAAYLKHWLGRLKEDSRLIVMAAASAQKAADWILGQRPEKDGDK